MSRAGARAAVEINRKRQKSWGTMPAVNTNSRLGVPGIRNTKKVTASRTRPLRNQRTLFWRSLGMKRSTSRWPYIFVIWKMRVVEISTEQIVSAHPCTWPKT